MDYTEIKQWLNDNLSEERYFHTIGTAECARELAEIFCCDCQKAYLAGLLHDCAKCFTKERLLEIINANLEVEEAELLNYKTLHAPVSAHIAKNNFGICDEEVLSAIRWHTLGKSEMSDFEKVVFIADKIEPNTRDSEYIQKIRQLLSEDNGLNKALLKCYKETIKSLVKRDLKICPLTIEIYNKLQDIVQN